MLASAVLVLGMVMPQMRLSPHYMHSVPLSRRGGAPAANEAAEIPFDVHFLRAAKLALRLALEVW
jgi:hypothetical protein